MGNIRFENIGKSFGEKRIIDSVSIEIEDGELFTFLGPSGCGKTTLLRLLAGFEKPDSGAVSLSGVDITDFAPEKREIGMVFQNYALFPNMNVAQNVGYGLKTRKVDKKTIEEKVKVKLEMVGMGDFGKRNIGELSGGEQQRVCIARALAIEPRVLLLDEPLSNLDAKLRARMRREIRELQSSLGITTIFVTHDQEEAMSISDRIAVFNRGEVVQLDTPFEIYNNPRDEFVAGFIGESNIISGSGFVDLMIEKSGVEKVCVRPQDIEITERGIVEATIVDLDFNGNHAVYSCLTGETLIKVSEINSWNKIIRHRGDKVFLKIDEKAVKKLSE